MAEVENLPSRGNREGAGKAFRSIQVLRGLAALLVVAFHIAPAFVIGAAGVDIFFIISGFIMGTAAIAETPDEFIGKRLIRIVPLYWSVTLLYVVASFIPGLSKSAFVSGPYFAQSLLFMPYVDPAGRIAPVLVAGWTLNFEMLFYLIFAAALFTKSPRFTASCAIAVLVVIGSIANPSSAALMTWTAPIMIEFVFGLALSALYTHFSKRVGVCALVAGLLGLGFAQWFQTGGEGWGLARILLWGLPAALIGASALAFEIGGGWPNALRPLERLGDVSYSLYLLHGIVSSVAYKVFANVVAADVFIVGGSIAAALVSFHCFERPVTNALRDLIRRGHKPSSGKTGHWNRRTWERLTARR